MTGACVSYALPFLRLPNLSHLPLGGAESMLDAPLPRFGGKNDYVERGSHLLAVLSG